MPNICPNKFPTLDSPYRLAIIGEAPGEDECDLGEPFVGSSGRMLNAILAQTGILKTATFLGNVCQHKPKDNKFHNFSWEGSEVQTGLLKLKQDLDAFDPHLCLLLGQTPLKAAGISHPVTSYRGSLFQSFQEGPFLNRKCLSTLHPAYLLRVYEDLPLFNFDLTRCKEEMQTKELNLPKRNYDIELSANQIIERLNAIKDGTLTSLDIEGGIDHGGISCLGVSTKVGTGFIINIRDFSEEEQVRILHALARVICSDLIPKVLQNSLYDNFNISWLWKLPVRNIVWDTMLSGWEIYPELSKGLATQTSICTRQPYYKFERKISDKLTKYRYCCTDADVTLEIALKHMEWMTPVAREHFTFNMQLLPAIMYMELRGIKYNKELALERCEELKVRMSELQTIINLRTSRDLNINSPKQMTQALYKDLSYPPQYAKENGRKTTRLTCDASALLTLLPRDNNDLIMPILQWRALEGQRKQLELNADLDGRIRCSYNLVGTETGRMSCSESPTGSGSNLTTIMKDNRDLYEADSDKYFFQCDLSGADGWTVAAHCLNLGDPTMFEDYLAGIKPARVIAAMYLHGWDVARMKQDELKQFIASIEIPDSLYFICKVIQHGSNYMMKKDTMSKNILLQSWKKIGKPIYFAPAESAKLQSMYLDGRYKGIRRWWKWVETEIARSSQLTDCSGHIRTFFGRKDNTSTLMTALSHEPQANTTYCTNKALWNLWHDKENINPDGSLIIEPQHQVHDALNGQFDKTLVEYAVKKITGYFNNPVKIAGQTLVIPFEGSYGSSWGKQEYQFTND